MEDKEIKIHRIKMEIIEDEDNPLTWHRQWARERGENCYTGD